MKVGEFFEGGREGKGICSVPIIHFVQFSLSTCIIPVTTLPRNHLSFCYGRHFDIYFSLFMILFVSSFSFVVLLLPSSLLRDA